MTRGIDYIEGFRNAAKRATSFLLLRSTELREPISRMAASTLAVELDLHMYDDLDPDNPEAKSDPAVFPPKASIPNNMPEALLTIRHLTTELEIARKFCSAAGDDYFRMINFLETNTSFEGTPYQQPMRETAKEIRDTGKFLKAIAAGKMDSVVYEDELTKSKRQVDMLRGIIRDQRDLLIEGHNAMMTYCQMNEATADIMARMVDIVAETEDEAGLADDNA